MHTHSCPYLYLHNFLVKRDKFSEMLHFDSEFMRLIVRYFIFSVKAIKIACTLHVSATHICHLQGCLIPNILKLIRHTTTIEIMIHNFCVFANIVSPYFNTYKCRWNKYTEFSEILYLTVFMAFYMHVMCTAMM